MQKKKQKLHIYFEENNAKWLETMEGKGVSRSAIVNLAIDILRPRLLNIETTDAKILEVAATK